MAACTNTTLTSGAHFISNVGGQANYTGALPDVFSCIAQLGANGCGFEHQLASVARALGADGAAPPAENAGFLRPNAELAIVLLTNEDDCSAPANTTLFGLNGGTQSITNPLGPIANYRCNQFGHLCKNPLSATPNALISPPLNAPTSSTTPAVVEPDRLRIERHVDEHADVRQQPHRRDQGAEGAPGRSDRGRGHLPAQGPLPGRMGSAVEPAARHERASCGRRSSTRAAPRAATT